MAEFKRGIKAGLVAGIISGIVFGIIFFLFNSTIFYDDIVTMLNQSLMGQSNISPELLEEYNLTVDDLKLTQEEFNLFKNISINSKLIMLIPNVFFSIIIGLLFAVLFSRLPGKTAIKKGLFVGILIAVLNLFFSLDFVSYFGSIYLILIVSNELFFGYLLGKFWIRFGNEEPGD